MREFIALASQGRSPIPAQVRLRRLLDAGDRLGLTAGDAVRLAVETLRALDLHGEFQPAIRDVLGSFDSGRLTTEFREPMNLYLERSAVVAVATVVCETCRPNVTLQGPDADPSAAESPKPPGAIRAAREWPVDPRDRTSSPADVAHWPERTVDGFPQITIDARIWWPGLPGWDRVKLTAYVSKSLAFAGGNFNLLIEQDGDSKPARANAVWLLRRNDVNEDLPVYELRASTWDIGSDAHNYRFLIASSSPWCGELEEYLTARWISAGKSPRGPTEFDAEPLGGRFGGDHPPIRPFVSS